MFCPRDKNLHFRSLECDVRRVVHGCSHLFGFFSLGVFPKASGLLWRLFSVVTIVLHCWGATSHDSEGWTRGVDEPITSKACCAQSPEGPLRLDMDSNCLPKTPSPHLQCHRSKEKSSAPFETIWPLRQAFGPLAL